MQPETAYQPSLTTLVKELFADLRTLIREEISLARVEMKEQATRARTAAVSLGIAAAALALGATFLLISAAVGIADAFDWPVWAGFLAVAMVLCLLGLVMFFAARRKLRLINPVPEETVSTIKENSEWIAKRLSSAPR